MAAPKTKTQSDRDHMLLQIAKYDRKGYDQHTIAEILGVSQPTISVQMKKIREMYKEDMLQEVKWKVNKRIVQLNELMCEAWNQYNRSTNDAEKRVVERSPEFVPPGKKSKGRSKLKISRVIKTKTGRLGDVAYLRVILDCLKELTDIEELKPKDSNNTNNVLVNWDMLAKTIQVQTPDLIEEKLKRLEAKASRHNEGLDREEDNTSPETVNGHAD